MVAVDTDHMSQNAEPAHGGPPLNGRSGASAPVRSFVWSDYPLERIRDAELARAIIEERRDWERRRGAISAALQVAQQNSPVPCPCAAGKCCYLGVTCVNP